MIDARRMEVFTALYKPGGKEVVKPAALVLNKESFKKELENSKILFFGNGSLKFMKLISVPNAIFEKFYGDCSNLSALSWQLFANQIWSDLVYTEPFYIKAFYTPAAGAKTP
jgi:tRNA threonylcarbamoyladenosine biosynthesis protein TsaB